MVTSDYTTFIIAVLAAAFIYQTIRKHMLYREIRKDFLRREQEFYSSLSDLKKLIEHCFPNDYIKINIVNTAKEFYRIAFKL